MLITDITFRHVNSPASKLQAFVTITLDDCLVVSDFRIFSSDSGFFLSMPSRKTRDGSFREVVYPISTTFRSYLNDTILRAFSDEIASPEFKSGRF